MHEQFKHVGICTFCFSSTLKGNRIEIRFVDRRVKLFEFLMICLYEASGMFNKE